MLLCNNVIGIYCQMFYLNIKYETVIFAQKMKFSIEDFFS